MKEYFKRKYYQLRSYYLKSDDNKEMIKTTFLGISLMILLLIFSLIPQEISGSILFSLSFLWVCYYIWNLPDKWFK